MSGEITWIKNKVIWFISTLISLGVLGGMISPYSPISVVARVEAVETEFYAYVANQNINDWQKRIYLLEDRYYGKVMPQSTKEEIRDLQSKIDRAKKG